MPRLISTSVAGALRRVILVLAFVASAAMAAYPWWRYDIVTERHFRFSGPAKVKLEAAARYFGVDSDAYTPRHDSSRVQLVRRAPLWAPPARAPQNRTYADTASVASLGSVIAEVSSFEYQTPPVLEFTRLVTSWVLVGSVAAVLLVALRLAERH